MSGEIASLLVKLGLDASAFTAGIAQADKTSAAFGKSLVTRSSVAKAGFVALGSGLAVVTQAGLQAEDAQGKFMAATGASRDEAKAFVSTMDGLAGTSGAVGKSFEDIAATGTMVAQQFGTTGQATADLTSNVLEFSKVTNTDATQAAAGMDDALSAYGLSASDAKGFMDSLIKSSQTFGTSVGVDTVKQIQDLAPAVQQLGGNIDDAVALENAFEVAGVDSAQAQKDLNAAILKLPPGTTLNDIVAHLGAIQDPTERGTEAIKLLGKAGIGLAAIIKPGQKSMDDFGVSAQDAAGSLDTAAGAMLTTGDKISGLKDKFLAGAREIGQQFGPALTGAASAASLVAPFAKQFAKLGAPAAKAFAGKFTGALTSAINVGASIGQRIAGKIAAPLTNALAGAFTSLSGNSKISGAMDKLGGFMGGKLGGAMKTGFLAAGIIGLIAVAIQEWGDLQKQIDANKKAAAGIDSATGDYLAGMPSAADVQAKIDALKQVPASLTGVQGALYNLGSLGEGNVIGSALDVLFGANPAQVLDDKVKQMQAYLDGPGKDAVGQGVDSVATAIAPDGAQSVSDAFSQYIQAWEDGSKSVIENGQELAGFDPNLGQWVTGKDFLDAAPDVQAAIQTWIQTQNSSVQSGVDTLGQSLDDMRKAISDKLSGIQDAFTSGVDTKKKKNISGADRLKQMADDIDTVTKRMHESIAANDPVNTAYWEDQLITLTNNYNTAKQSVSVDSSQIEADVATATSGAGTDLTQLGNKAGAAASSINQAAGNVNLNPAANNIATATSDIHDSFMHIGTYASNVPGAISQADKGASAAAKHMAALIADPLNALNPYAWGTHLGDDLVAGMHVGNTKISAAAVHWAHLLSDPLKFSRPPLKGPLHTVGEWGPHMIDAWIQPMLRHGMVKVPKAAQQLAEWMKAAGQQKSADWYDTAAPLHQHRRRHNGVSNPSVADTTDSSAGITINVTVQGNVYGTGGVKQLAKDLETYIKRSQRGGARLVGAF